MAIITIAHQIGSGGREIGQLVAQKMGLPYVDHEIVQDVAKELGISISEANDMHEKADNVFSQVLTLFRYNVTSPLTAKPAQVDTITYQEATKAVLEKVVASENVVIAGHGANFYLAGRPNILSVFIYAPPAYRINVIKERDQISQVEATRQVQQNDTTRAHYIRSLYGADWRDPNEYHLMINTAICPFDLAADLIMQAANHSFSPLPQPNVSDKAKV